MKKITRPHYYIDGYNFLFRLCHKRRNPLQARRESLVKRFNERVEELGLDITIVFDGEELPYGDYTRGHWRSVEVVYTHEGLSADDYILEQLALSRHPAVETVVSCDRQLISKSHLLGASSMSIEVFLSFLEKKQQKRLRAIPIREAVDSRAQIERLQKIFENRLREQNED